MKKFVKTILSVGLVGTMAFGLAACDKPEGESALLKAIDATLAAQNYTMKIKSGMDATFYYNGELLAADTVIKTEDGEVTGSDLFLGLEMISDKEEFKNPFYASQQNAVIDCDIEGGLVSWAEENNGETRMTYNEVVGTTLNNYYQYEKWEWDNETGVPNITYAPARSTYTGFVSNEQAKKLLKANIAYEAEGITLDNILTTQVKGIGKNSSRKGTIKELYDLFDYNEATKTYSVKIDASEEAGAPYANCSVEISVEDGKVSYVGMSVPGDEYVEDMISGMPEGITAKVTMTAGTEYYNYGKASVTIPDEVKQVEEDYISEMPILSSEDVWKTLLAGIVSSEFKISYTAREEVDGVRQYIYTNIYVDTESNTAAFDQVNYETYSQTVKFFKAADGKLSTYVGQSNFGMLSGYAEPTLTDISGDATAGLMAALPAYAQDYYAGFEGGALKDQFAKFELATVYSYTATLKLNGKEVKVVVLYDYSEGEYSLGNVYIYYGTSEYYEVTANAKTELNEYYSPDNYKE